MCIRDRPRSRQAHAGTLQAEDGIRDRSPSRGLGDVYKRQVVKPDNEAIRGMVNAVSHLVDVKEA